MTTRIGRLADNFMEATILVAVLAIPILFNPYSARVFEGEKVALLRVLAVIAAAAWLVRTLEEAGAGRSQLPALADLSRQPVVLAAVLTGLVAIAASLTSIAPRLTLWGSYQRGQGLITTLCYLILFFVAVRNCVDPPRRRRLMTTLLAASAPIALLALVQFAGLNPVPLRSLDPSRVFGTLSNPIFLGAYLVLVIPLTLAQLARYRFTADGLRWGGPAGFGLLLALQAAAVAFSNSRGPVLGVAVGLLFLLLLLAVQGRQRWIAGAVVLAAVIGLVVLVVFSLPGSPLAPLQGVPVIGRFGEVAESGSAQVRVLIWQAVVDRFAGEPARLVLGYGPESTQAALGPSYQPELRRLEPERLPDRAHNAFLEALVTGGLVGVAGLVLLFGALFYTGLRSMGLLATARWRNLWLALMGGGVVLGALAPRLIVGNWLFAGPGTGLGLTAGLAGFLLVRVWRPEGGAASAFSDRSILAAGILAALVGHLVEITFGIRVTVTESLLWVLAGLLVALSMPPEARALGTRGRSSRTKPGTDPAAPSQPHRSQAAGSALIWAPEPAALGMLGGLMLATLSFGLFLLPGAGVATSEVGRWSVLVGSWALAGLLWQSPPDAAGRPGTGWLYPVISAVWAGLFIALRTLVPALGGDALTLLNLYFVWLLLSLAVIALLLPGRPAAGGTAPAWKTLVYPALGVVALVLAAWLGVRPLYADIYLEAAQANAAAGQWSQAVGLFQKAAEESPGVDEYQRSLGEAFVTVARLTQDPGQREALFQAGREAFERAVRLNPADGAHRFNLAHLHLLWAQVAGDPARQATLLDQAAILYEQAAAQTPLDPRVLTEWGRILQEQGDDEGALAKYRAAIELDPHDAQAYLQIGILHALRGDIAQAVEVYQQAIELEPDRVEVYRALADAYRQEGRLLEAVAAQRRAAELRPTDYAIHQNLALLYRDLGQIQNAVAEARLALTYAPPEVQPALQNFVQSLLAASAP